MFECDLFVSELGYIIAIWHYIFCFDCESVSRAKIVFRSKMQFRYLFFFYVNVLGNCLRLWA